MNTHASPCEHTLAANGAMTIDEFCSLHAISRTTLNRLRRKRRAPEVIRIGRKAVITAAEAERWRTEIEARALAALEKFG